MAKKKESQKTKQEKRKERDEMREERYGKEFYEEIGATGSAGEQPELPTSSLPKEE